MGVADGARHRIKRHTDNLQHLFGSSIFCIAREHELQTQRAYRREIFADEYFVDDHGPHAGRPEVLLIQIPP